MSTAAGNCGEARGAAPAAHLKEGVDDELRVFARNLQLLLFAVGKEGWGEGENQLRER